MSDLHPEIIPRWKKTWFDLFISLNKDLNTMNRVFLIMSVLVKIVDHFNKLSLIVFASSFIKGFSSSFFLIQFLSIVRLDVMICDYSDNYTFALFFMIILALNVILKIFLYFQCFYSRNYYKSLIIFTAKMTGMILMELLQIPIINFSIETISFVENNRKTFEYKDVLFQGSPGMKLAIIFSFMIYLIMLIMDIVLNVKLKYDQFTMSRAFSFLHLKELLLVLFLVICKISINSKFFFLLSAACSLYQSYEIFMFLPFFNNRLNLAFLQVWTSVFLLSVLSFTAEIYEKFSIIEVIFPFLYLFFIIFNHEAINKRLASVIKKKRFKNPFTAELKIRSVIFKKPKNLEEKIQKHFKTVTQDFFSFKLQYVWESVIISKYLKDKNLALMKLSKFKLSDYKESPENIQSNFNQNFRYPITLETEFLHYQVFSRIVTKVPEMGFDILLLSFSTNLRKFIENDKKLLRKLQNFCYSFTDQITSKAFDRKLNSIGKSIRKYLIQAKKMLLKFGEEKDFLRLFESFCEDILKIDEFQNHKKTVFKDTLKRNLSKKLTSFDNCGAVLVISGNLSNLGKIIYANKFAAVLLKADSVEELIGMSYLKLIPYPFDEIHNNVLVKFVMYRNSSKLQRDHICVIDKYGNCIEVCMYFRMSFYKSNTFFILNLKQILPEQNIILSSISGEVYSFSSKITDIFPNISKELFCSLPNFKNYLQNNAEGEIFYYCENEERFLMKYKILRIGSYELMMVYVSNENSDSLLYNNDINLKEVTDNLINELSRKTDLFTNPSKFNEEFEKLSRENRWKKYSLATRVLKILIKTFSVLQILVMVALLIAVYKIVGQLKMNYIIFDIGLMRYLSSSTLSNIFSLDLLSNNYTLAFSEQLYRTNVVDNIARFQGLLSKYQKVTIPVTKESKHYFDDQHFITFLEIGNISYEKPETLIDFMLIFVRYAQIISNTSLSNFSSIEPQKKFLFKNIPTNYIDTLNKTVFRVMNDFSFSLYSIFRYLENFELFCVFFPALLLIFSTICLIYIESGNRLIWSMINKIEDNSLTTFRKSLQTRLKNTHKIIESLETLEKINLKFHYKLIAIKPFCIIFCFFLLSIGFYFSITLSSQHLLKAMIEQDLVHTNFGGLRRMMAPLSLFWGRNAALRSIHRSSFDSWFMTNPIGSSKSRLEFLIKEYSRTQNLLMGLLNEYPSNQYKFNDYVNLMYGDSCDYITIVDNCTFTFVRNGLDSSLNFYLQELETLGNLKETVDVLNFMIKVEKFSKLIEKSFVFGLFVYANYTTEVIEGIKMDISMTVLYFVLATVLFYFFLLRKISEDINVLFENKIFIVSAFNS